MKEESVKGVVSAKCVDYVARKLRQWGEGPAWDGKPVPVELRLQHAKAGWIQAEAVARNLLNDPNIQGLVVNCRDISARKTAEERLTHNAFHDVLTNLPNRALFLDRLRRAFYHAKRHPEYNFAVLFIDLDNFKTLNDTLGHLTGDLLLQEVARREVAEAQSPRDLAQHDYPGPLGAAILALFWVRKPEGAIPRQPF